MTLRGSTGPPTGSPPLPGDPFTNYPNAGIQMSVNPSLANQKGYYVTQVIPDCSNLNNIQNFNSGAVGNPSPEQIWAFKMRQMANDIDLMRGLVQNMIDTVPPNRDAWAQGAKTLQTAITALENASGTVCEITAKPKPNQ